MPEQIKKKIVDPRIMPYLDYIFETQDALRKMDKYFSMFLATSKGSLPDSEIKTFGKLKQDIVLLKSIYSNLGTDFLKGDDIDIKTLKQLHEINQEIIKITSL